MQDFFIRTEDIKIDEIEDYFVETTLDRSIIEQLKSRSPIILVGSRGVGKSFLLRIAEKELLNDFATQGALPVYITFRKSSLIHTDDGMQFYNWMLSRICSDIIRALFKSGRMTFVPKVFSTLVGNNPSVILHKTKIEELAEKFEDSWKNPGTSIDLSDIPTVDDFVTAIEDICTQSSISRIVLFIDEAAHIFLPEQQRQFFTLFRDLRSPYINCNAAVYPGVTSFGDTFQPTHDATILTLQRDIQDKNYILNMREIVLKQIEDSTLTKAIARRGELFGILAYAANGNPRNLLKTLSKITKLDNNSINTVIREFYRTDIWSEHSSLADKYPGHRSLVDWGRQFIEAEVLPELQKKNTQYLLEDKKTSCFFWMHRDTPQVVKEAVRLLQYTGIVTEHATGIKATRSEIGTRYLVNMGCLVAMESLPSSTAYAIASNITPKRMSEYGANHNIYDTLTRAIPKFYEPNLSNVLINQLKKAIDILDLTDWQKSGLHSIDINTIGDIINATEKKLQEIQYIGEKRSRRMRNVAFAAVFEYLSG